MEEPNDPRLQPGSSSTSTQSRNGEYSGAASTSTSLSSSQVREEEPNQSPEIVRQALTYIRDDTCSCIIVVLVFWFFVSITLILGVYGSLSLRLGPDCSLLIKPNPVFVKYVKVKQLDATINGPRLYGFYKDPTLDVLTASSESHSAFLPTRSQKDWIYFLNEGSKMNISFSVNSPSLSSLVLVIAQGSEDLVQWLVDPLYPNTTLSWNIIQGNGMIQQDITKSSNYYVSVGNLNSEIVEVKLNFTIRALLYDTTEAYYKCFLARGECSFKLFFPSGNAAVLTTPGHNQVTSDDEWYVKLSYGPRWITYSVGIGGTTVLMLLAFHLFNKFQCTRDNRTGVEYREIGSERALLLSHKDDDLSSWGSSYDSVSQDDENLEDGHVVAMLDGPLKDGENNSNIQRLCAICFDAPRDCFFLPCGHCVACFACATRIAEAAGTCPICRRNMKKVRKIFTV